MAIKTVQYVTIGDEYAKRLGYEELVGAMAIIDNVMEALVGVTVISGAPEFIGTQIDIHKGDALLEHPEAPSKLYAVADFVAGKIYYSSNKDFAEKSALYIGANQTQVFNEFEHIHELIDELYIEFPYRRKPSRSFFGGFEDDTRHPMNWMAYPLDDESCEVTKKLRDTYEANKKAEEHLAKRKIEIQAEKKKKVQSLTDSLKSQLTSHLDDAPIQIIQLGYVPMGDSPSLFANQDEDAQDSDYPDDDSFEEKD